MKKQEKKAAAKAMGGFGMRIWGYLPGAVSQDRAPLLKPTRLACESSGWKAVCSGGLGSAMAISVSGRLKCFGSTKDGGSNQYTGNHQLGTAKVISLPTKSSCAYAVAGWAHCAAVTDDGKIYSWGWKECCPSEKPSEQQSNTASMKNLVEGHSELCDAGVGNGIESDADSHMISSLSHERANEELLDEVVKKRRLNVEDASSSEIIGMDDNDYATAEPQLVLFPQRVVIIKVAAGGRHTLALTDIGHVWGWGSGGEGQLGLGSRVCSVSSPRFVPCVEPTLYFEIDGGEKSKAKLLEHMQKVPGTCIVEIACGVRHSAVLTDAGALLTFGWGLYGQCGQGSTDDELIPCYVSSLGGLQVIGVAAGLWHTLCITSTGDVYAFGGNQFGQLGVGGDQTEMLPRLVEASVLEEQNVTCVSAGARHSAICTEKGEVFCWGWNKYGQLGLGDTVNRDTPVQVPFQEKAYNVACGWWHTLCLVHTSSVR